jgi:hypothetical protein
MTLEETTLDRAKHYILEPGGYNDMPKPYQEITEERFWHHVLIWGFGNAHGYRQINPVSEPELFGDLPRNEQYYRSMQIIYYHNEAFAVMQKVEHAIPKPFKFFRIGCDHKEATGSDTIRGWHDRTCPTCGLSWSWDSSD